MADAEKFQTSSKLPKAGHFIRFIRSIGFGCHRILGGAVDGFTKGHSSKADEAIQHATLALMVTRWDHTRTHTRGIL